MSQPLVAFANVICWMTALTHCMPNGCLPNGTCSVISPIACYAQCGQVMDGEDCSGVSCPQPRACCIPGLGCEFLTEQCCLARGGSWQAEGTTCPGGANPVDCSMINPEMGGGDPGKGDDESPIPIPADPPQQIVERGGDIELPGEVYLDREYVYGPDYVDEFIAQFDRDGHAIFMLQDGNYNVVALVSGPGHPGGDDGQGNPQPLPTGTVLEQYTYEPYGALVAAEMFYPHAMNRAGHQGLFFERFDGSYDDHTLFRVAQGTAFITGAKGLYYNRNRYYSPSLGRFTTRDPNETALPIITALASNATIFDIVAGVFDARALFGDGINLYVYLDSNPVNRNDPLGLYDPFEDVDDWVDDRIGNALYTLGTLNEKILSLGSALGVAASLLPGSQIFSVIDVMQNGVGGFWGAMSLAVDLLPGGKALKGIGRAFKWRWTAKAVKGGVKLTGQIHHAISAKVHRALEKHQFLKGKYKARDSRFTTQAVDSDAHKGYQAWHRDYDEQVRQAIEKNEHWTQSDFEAYLKELYDTHPDLTQRFPNGL